ncbi:protein ecdysoneless homolog isoform X1 [Callorhinchus milii]|uniref:protein ecdysoneless homolog isoform X1 n=1 Tax=Callorhinchus milii TaxID=7868 RepID=UPI001C3FD488|nr:protein ecdysoneless homolog isoform X1 [Callorhinchus milii]
MEGMEGRLEDGVCYRLHLAGEPRPSGETSQQRLEQILALLASPCGNYIWHNEPFNLTHVPARGEVPAHIGGVTNFGDNVDDEWFIVYLIQRVSKEFPDLVASIEDNDGEFLLIEAAEYLPKWLNPETSTNRVFFYHGKLHIIPLPQNPGEVSWLPVSNPTLPQALSLLATHSEKCLAAGPIREAVDKRIHSFPGKIRDNQHQAYCYVPAGIAAVLKHRPDLLAPAVQAFYLRDPIDLNACRIFKIFQPDTRVMTLVTFTKCLYAQLQQQRFIPDRRSGYTLPAQSDKHFKAHELGMKLAHGFEILCSKSSQPVAKTESGISTQSNPHWKGFLSSLTKSDYFKGELEGSAHYRELLRTAEIYFQQSVVKPESSSAFNPGENILHLLQTLCYSAEELKKEEDNLPPEDDNSWLVISPEELDHMLEEASGKKLLNSVSPEECYDLQEVTESMKAFVSKVSTHEGAELPWSSSASQVQFDVNTFTSALEKILSVESDDCDSDDIDDDDDFFDAESYTDERMQEGEPSTTETLENLRDYMKQMDLELASTNIGKSFTKVTEETGSDRSKTIVEAGNESETESERNVETHPVDVDLNLVQNLLQSYSSQTGLAGPASNILQSMGVRLPDNQEN